MDMYTRLAVRAKLGAPPVLTLEARPTRASCAALSLILVRINWTGLSASRGKPGSRLPCALFSAYSHRRNGFRSFLKGVKHLWKKLALPAAYSCDRRLASCAM